VTLIGYGSASLSSGAGTARSGFGITGDVSGLYPGQIASLQLTISNPKPFEISVTSITTAVGSATRTCPAAYLSVGAFSGHLRVGANGKATTTVTATLEHSAPDACQGAMFPLAYTGNAVRA